MISDTIVCGVKSTPVFGFIGVLGEVLKSVVLLASDALKAIIVQMSFWGCLGTFIFRQIDDIYSVRVFS